MHSQKLTRPPMLKLQQMGMGHVWDGQVPWDRSTLNRLRTILHRSHSVFFGTWLLACGVRDRAWFAEEKLLIGQAQAASQFGSKTFRHHHPAYCWASGQPP